MIMIKKGKFTLNNEAVWTICVCRTKFHPVFLGCLKRKLCLGCG